MNGGGGGGGGGEGVGERRRGRGCGKVDCPDPAEVDTTAVDKVGDKEGGPCWWGQPAPGRISKHPTRNTQRVGVVMSGIDNQMRQQRTREVGLDERNSTGLSGFDGPGNVRSGGAGGSGRAGRSGGRLVAGLMTLRLGLLGALLLVGVGGCEAFGSAAGALGKPPVKAAYAGLAGQSVGVMVWVDRGIRIDYPAIQLDVANTIQAKLVEAQQKGKVAELKGTIFPVEARSVARYQADHPEIEALPITEVAPRLNVSRLIYVEISDFQTRPEATLDLYRGVVTGSIKVVAVDQAGNAKLVYDEREVRTVFPKKSPPEGVTNTSDIRIYNGVLEDFTTDVAVRFFEHDAPEE